MNAPSLENRDFPQESPSMSMSTSRNATSLASLLLVLAAACSADDGAERSLGNDPPLASRDELLDGAPRGSELPRQWKADETLPVRFDLRATQSPVKSQERRGVCSIFATVALMEHLYLAAGATSADFSEQYLQWSAKEQAFGFPNTSGSNASINLRAINQFGIPDEAAWPYEGEQWNGLNDPACVGEDPLPTRCYTNGAPPEAAVQAHKYTLPRGRWLSSVDVKADIKNRNQGVLVGFDFFYQSWNHRLSKLPVSSDNWAQGIVLYPNEEDVRLSLEERAGHAVLLIGWDDEMEVPIRDKDGNTVVGSDGNVVTEKGFYLFKNSWGTDSFGVDNVFGPGYGWVSQRYMNEYASFNGSDLPTIVPPPSGELCDDALDNDGDVAVDCDDSDCSAALECAGGSELGFDGPAGLEIPDSDPAGVAAALEVPVTGTILGLTVKVAIEHTYRSDLRVALEHDGTTVTLHDRTGGGADGLTIEITPADWNGGSITGTWRLLVVDGAPIDTGKITSWSLTARVE
jgi:C1A family cysteine protease